MRNLKRDVLAVLLGALSVVALVLGSLWLKELRPATKRGGQEPAEPFRIAGNFYYVGANDLAAFLITGPEGHIVLDGGYPTTAPMILASIATLGFDIKDVKVLLNSAPYAEHAGGLAALQQASGAELWASEASAGIIASGGDDPDLAGPLRALIRIGLFSYPAARVDHRFKDGDTIRVGSIALTAHVTARPHARLHLVVVPRPRRRPRAERRQRLRTGRDGREAVPGTASGQRAQLTRAAKPSRRHLGDLTAPGPWGRYRKFVASKTAKNPVDPFIDPEGYHAFIDAAEDGAPRRSGPCPTYDRNSQVADLKGRGFCVSAVDLEVRQFTCASPRAADHAATNRPPMTAMARMPTSCSQRPMLAGNGGRRQRRQIVEGGRRRTKAFERRKQRGNRERAHADHHAAGDAAGNELVICRQRPS